MNRGWLDFCLLGHKSPRLSTFDVIRRREHKRRNSSAFLCCTAANSPRTPERATICHNRPCGFLNAPVVPATNRLVSVQTHASCISVAFLPPEPNLPTQSRLRSMLGQIKHFTKRFPCLFFYSLLIVRLCLLPPLFFFLTSPHRPLYPHAFFPFPHPFLTSSFSPSL